MRLTFGSPTALFAAIALSSPTALTYTKYLATPTAGYFLQQHPGILFDMLHLRSFKQPEDVVEYFYWWGFRLISGISEEARSWLLRASFFLIVRPTLPVYTLFLDTVRGESISFVFIYITVCFNGILEKLVGHFISARAGHFY